MQLTDAQRRCGQSTSQVAHLRAHPELIGTLVTVAIADPSDVRCIRCATPEGARLPDLEVVGRWAHVAHDLSTRRAVWKEHRDSLLRVQSADPVAAYRGLHRERGETCKMSPRGDREGLLRKILATPPGEYRVDDFTALLVCDRVALASEAKVHPSTMRHAPQSDDVLDANPVAATPTRAE